MKAIVQPFSFRSSNRAGAHDESTSIGAGHSSTGSNFSPSHIKYRPDIDGLRAIAVLSVVIFHAFPTLLPGGFAGVDIFFVISGYLIGSILIREFQNDDFSIARFYARRIKRIFPALILVLVACYAFGWFNLLDDEFMQLGKHIVAGASFVSNLALWSESGYFDVAAETKPLLHLWSLGVEEQFYLVWPLVLYACTRLRKSVLAATLAIGVMSFALNIVTIGHDPTADFYSPLTRFWELMVGCLLAYQHTTPSGRLRVGQPAKSVLGVALLVVSCVALRGADDFPGWRALLPTLGAFLIIDGGSGSVINRRVLASRPLVWVGLISFPLYLWHWPILSYARILAGDTPAWQVRLGAVAAAVVLAWLTYQIVERPIRAKSSVTIGRAKIAVLTVLTIAVALQGYNTYARQGLKFRLTKAVDQFAHVERDITGPWREHQCFLGGNEESGSFSTACTDSGPQPLIFLWGDSHAAALYPGLRDVQQRNGNFRLAQYTASGCAPALGGDASDLHCRAVQERAMSFLERDKPDTVILTASWTTQNLHTLLQTVAAIRRSGVRDIVVVGPVPRWPEGLPKVYWRYWRKSHEVLPVYSRFGLDPGVKEIDDDAQKIALQLGIRYVSAYRAMCNENGCITRSGPGKGEITTWDDAHLTPPESISLMKQLGPAMLPGANPRTKSATVPQARRLGET